MALSIKSDEADRLARELATAAHESITGAVTVDIRERPARFQSLPGPDIVTAARLLAVDYLAGATHEPRSADEIIGSDEHGLPV